MSADFSSNQKNVRAGKQIQRNVLLKYIWVWLFWEYLYLLSNNARQCKSHFWHFSPGKFWHPAEKATRLQAECIPLWQERAPQQNVWQKHFNSTGGYYAIRANVWQTWMLHYKHSHFHSSCSAETGPDMSSVHRSFLLILTKLFCKKAWI